MSKTIGEVLLAVNAPGGGREIGGAASRIFEALTVRQSLTAMCGGKAALHTAQGSMKVALPHPMAVNLRLTAGPVIPPAAAPLAYLRG